MSYPSSGKWVAKEWRNVSGVAGLDSPALCTACFTAFCKTDSCTYVFGFLLLPDPCSGSLQEIPIAIPTLFPHWDICDRERSAERLGPSRDPDRAGVVV